MPVALRCGLRLWLGGRFGRGDEGRHVDGPCGGDVRLAVLDPPPIGRQEPRMRLVHALQPARSAGDERQLRVDLERDLGGDRAGGLDPSVQCQPRKGRDAARMEQRLEEDRGVGELPIVGGRLRGGRQQYGRWRAGGRSSAPGLDGARVS